MNNKTVIIGNGQLAQIFSTLNVDNTVIFASGVSNSECKDNVEFEREKKLLLKTLKSYSNNQFVYFSSCALSVNEYDFNEYYLHKLDMENLIKKYSNNYYIIRIPQLFGDFKLHKTLINFIYHAILYKKSFKVYTEAYRYVIDISDVREVVEAYLNISPSCITIDVANYHRYSVLDIVQIFEKLLVKKANYEVIDKRDQYVLDLSEFQNFVDEHELELEFGSEYLYTRLKKYIERSLLHEKG